MKRKLNEENVPERTESSESKTGSIGAGSFDSLNLSAQLLRAIIAQKYSAPTAIQARVIPLVLQGKDILARSSTGTGKTAAYVLPILECILSGKNRSTSPLDKCVSSLILVPTRELASQVTRTVQLLAMYCGQAIRVENMTKKEDDKVQRARLASLPDILVTTPGKVAAHVNCSNLVLDTLKYLVIDEADLVLSYGYEADLRTISAAMPQGVQSILMSATLHNDINTLQALFCKNAVSVLLDEEEKKKESQVEQYVVRCAEDEKFLLCYAIFILKLIKGKIIIFVGDIDRCYQLKLFLEQFGVRSCVLNSELPVNSRIHVVEEFNRNVYDIIIATDENEIIGEEFRNETRSESKSESAKKKQVGTADTADTTDTADMADKDQDEQGKQKPAANPEICAPARKKRKTSQKVDKNYGVARGIDFKNVACVLNFDLPTSSKSYTHRIGRTARAGRTGMALSLVVPTAAYHKHKWTSIPSTQHDETVLSKIIENQTKLGKQVKRYEFDMAQLSGFRYRLEGALKAVTPNAIRQARVRELRQELIKSDKLKRHFEENPEDLRALRHDGLASRAARIKPHLKHVPTYLLPATSGVADKADEVNVGHVGPYRGGEDTGRRFGRGKRNRFVVKKKTGQTGNPLQSFRSSRSG